MISVRYVPAVCVMLALALIPTIIHTYSEAPDAESRVATALPMALASYQGTASDRNATWGKRRFDSDDWTERWYGDGETRKALRLTVVRSYDAKALYHHPELAITYPQSRFSGEETRRFDERPDVPVHVLKPDAGEKAEGVYALYYDGRFIDNPIAFQIRTAAELLFSRRKPMTLLFVFDRASEKVAGPSRAVTLLFSAIDALAGSEQASTARSN